MQLPGGLGGKVRVAASEPGGALAFIAGVTRCGTVYRHGRIRGSIVAAPGCPMQGIRPVGAGALPVRTPLEPVPVEMPAGGRARPIHRREVGMTGSVRSLLRLSLAVAASAVAAQSYPTRPIRVIVACQPGG